MHRLTTRIYTHSHPNTADKHFKRWYLYMLSDDYLARSIFYHFFFHFSFTWKETRDRVWYVSRRLRRRGARHCAEDDSLIPRAACTAENSRHGFDENNAVGSPLVANQRPRDNDDEDCTNQTPIHRPTGLIVKTPLSRAVVHIRGPVGPKCLAALWPLTRWVFDCVCKFVTGRYQDT